MSKDLTSKMHIKMKLFSHKLQESDSVLNHISVFKEIVADLVSMEVQFDDEDLGLLLLCSLPSSYANFRDTILLSRDELILAKVYEALQNREKMKGMVQSDASSSKGEALQVRGRSEQRTYTTAMIVTRARVEAVLSLEVKSSVSIAKRKITSLKNVGSCRIKRKGNLMVRPLLLPVLITLIQEIVLLLLLVVLLVMINGYLILHVRFISALTEIGLVLTSLCRMEMLCAWEMITHVRSWALAMFRSRHMMA
jgi:hypothetical protein